MTRLEVIAELEAIIRETRLSARCGKYEYNQTAHVYFSKSRPRLVEIVAALKEKEK